MRRTVLLSVAIALAVLLVSEVWNSAAREARALTKKPNLVFILADDMRKDDLRHMPKTRSVLKGKGMDFQNAYNTGVWNNGAPKGGWQTYRAKGLERDNVATRLDDEGYRTALIGKYLNGYTGTTNKPPGWDLWFAHTGSFHYFDYKINYDGTVRRFGSSKAAYETDV